MVDREGIQQSSIEHYFQKGRMKSWENIGRLHRKVENHY
jgi:hypothetical protein